MSGSEIGGAVGAVAGAFVGIYLGMPAQGAQIGYAIGSSIGGYVDPVRVKGPRLTDAAAQTSNVGVPLPFGYGVFPISGNIIWADELKEHVKRQRQGKGGGTKTTTYTYTRSYAIGICEGPIYGYVQIKRNGKLVYTSDPNAPVNDKDYSAKWLQKVTLYYGDEEQMPDSTIEAVVGAGNVAAFRGLAYIVVENDDLTDLAGAIPQYEFVVNATQPDVFITSKPYPVLSDESVFISASPVSGTLRTIMHRAEYEDNVGISASPITGELRDNTWRRTAQDNVGITAQPISGTLKSAAQVTDFSDDISISASPISGTLKMALIAPETVVDNVSITAQPISGTLQ